METDHPAGVNKVRVQVFSQAKAGQVFAPGNQVVQVQVLGHVLPINTDVYKENLKNKIALSGTDEDEIFIGLNNYFRKLAERQIRIAFEQSEKEVTDLRQRTKEGIREARRLSPEKQFGQKQGAHLNVKKKQPAKNAIKKYSKYFDGTLNDSDVIKLVGLSRNTFYKYKKELFLELS